MNYRQLLKFYFRADRLNDALDALALRYAERSADFVASWEYYADNICRITEAKAALGRLWAFLDWAMSTMKDDDRATLEKYSRERARRPRTLSCDEGGGKALHRSLMKFSRRVSGKMERFSEQVKVLGEYFCLLGA